jgi:hypothetical protein
MSTTFRNSAAFGKRIEFYVVGLMLKEGLDVYLPLVDDDAIDAVVKKTDGSYVEVQIKARSNDVKFGSAGLFAALKHEYRPNYWFLFYSQRMDKTWLLSSKEFLKEAIELKSGNSIDKKTIKFNGKNTKLNQEHVLPQFEKYVVTNFNRILTENPDSDN